MKDMRDSTKIGLIICAIVFLVCAAGLYVCIDVVVNYGEDSSSYEIEQAIPVATSENNSSYEIEQATPIGVSQSHSPDIICETDEFKIEQLTLEVLSVFAREESYTHNNYGYVEAFDNAIIEIGRNNYKIESITAVNDYVLRGSETRQLLVIVSLRNSSVNYNSSANG